MKHLKHNKRSDFPRDPYGLFRVAVLLAMGFALTAVVVWAHASRPLTYLTLLLLYGGVAALIVLSRTVGERESRLRQMQEAARANRLIGAALTGSELQVFEVRSDGCIRKLATAEREEGLQTTEYTPEALLDALDCDETWGEGLRALLDQGRRGQAGGLRLKTRQDTWLQLKIEPLANNPDTAAIGTLRDVTREVENLRRGQMERELLGRMMAETMAGMSVFPEENRWEMLWDRQEYFGDKPFWAKSYDQFLRENVLPLVHPRDREKYLEALDRKALISAFLTGGIRVTMDYRIRPVGASEYQWHETEMHLFREPSRGQIKCNIFLRRVDEEKKRELEERNRLEERERALLRRARELVRSSDQLGFVSVIADYYKGIYAVDLNRDEARSIKSPAWFTKLLKEGEGHFSRAMETYRRTQVSPDCEESLQEATDYPRLRRLLEEGSNEVTYQRRDGTWICLRVFPMPDYGADHPETLWVFEDETLTVTLRKKEEAAQVSAQAAQAASEAKSQFLANMSHEIRTPLNAILGMAELGLRESGRGEKDSRLREIRSSGRSLLEIINSILDLSKIESGKMEIIEENYRMHSVLNDVVTVLQMRAKEKKLEFTAEIDPALPAELFGDDASIRHILMNLGGNAIKYTPMGTVSLTMGWEPAQEEDGILVIHMKDTGIGIRQEDIPRLFESYGRLDQQVNRHVEGTGLGLPICQKLAKLMHGRIGVESVYGRGSDFWVRIPQRVVDPAPGGEYRAGEAEEQVQQATFAAPEAVVLLVDDQPVNLKVCEGLLQPYGCQVDTAASGQEALEKVKELWPDLILMDHMMPGMDGVEATKRIRDMGEKNPYFTLVPIIALTANAMKGAREFFLNSGFNDFLSKPIELGRLDAMLRRWIPEEKRTAPLPAAPQTQAVPEDLAALEGVDAARGMAYCGTYDNYRKTLDIFRQQIPSRAEQIETAWKSGDLSAYIIETHALKSAARWIGAVRLGDLAEAMELAGKGEDREKIDRETPELLADSRRLWDVLSMQEKPEKTGALSEKALWEKLNQLQSYMEDYDLDHAEDWIRKMDGCLLRPAWQEDYRQVCRAVAGVDYEDCLDKIARWRAHIESEG